MRGKMIAGLVCMLALLAATPSVAQQEEMKEAVSTSARAFSFQAIEYVSKDPSDAPSTVPVAINDSGIVVGTIVHPGAFRSPASCWNGGCGSEMFIWQDGELRLLAGPAYQGHFTSAVGINNRDQILLLQQNNSGMMNHHDQYFLYDMKNKSFRPVSAFVQVAGSVAPIRMVRITGVNDAGQIVGFYRFKGKLWGAWGEPVVGSVGATAELTEGARLTPIECPEGRSTKALAINNRGEITGACEGGNKPPTRRGFVLRDRAMTLFDAPGAIMTEGNAINDSGIVVGEYTLKPLHAGLWPVTGFAWDGTRFVPVVMHGGTQGMASRATGINNRGHIVGADGERGQGFIATPAGGNPLRAEKP